MIVFEKVLKGKQVEALFFDVVDVGGEQSFVLL